MLSIPFAEVLRIMIAARGDTGGIPQPASDSAMPAPADLPSLLAALNQAELAEILALALLGDYLLEGLIELDYPLEQLAATSISRGPAPDQQ